MNLPAPRVSLRRFPRLLRAGLRIVLAAGRRELVIIVALQIAGGLAIGVAVLVGEDMLAGLLDAHAEGAGFERFLPSLLLLGAVTTVVGVLHAVERARRELLQELTGRFVQERILEVGCAAELDAFERPEFHDRLARAQANGRTGPVTLVFGLTQLLRSTAASIGLVVAVLAIAPVLVPIALLTVVPAWLATRLWAESYVHFAFRMTPRDRERTYLAQLLTGRASAQEVRAFDLAPFLRRRHDRLWDERLDDLRGVVRRELRFSVLAGLGSALAIGSALALLIALTLDGGLSLSDAGAAGAAILFLGRQLTIAGFGAGELHSAALFVEDFESFLGLASNPPALSRRDGPPRADPQPLIADEVTFTYPSGTRPALQRVSIRIDPGEVVALVGENGSGKTTLAKLLSGLYPAGAGEVRWGGRVLDDGGRRALRESVAIIFQDFIRYALSAHDNIALGRHERYDDDAAVVDAATHAGADTNIRELPDGYDTQLGPQFQGGTELSTGQWQRIALARAFFRDASLVILDEPTAALDARAEHELFEDLRTLLAGRSALLISHRFSSVRSADRIYVMHAGEIVEHGTHDELITRGGRYAELFALQAASYIDHGERHTRASLSSDPAPS